MGAKRLPIWMAKEFQPRGHVSGQSRGALFHRRKRVVHFEESPEGKRLYRCKNNELCAGFHKDNI